MPKRAESFSEMRWQGKGGCPRPTLQPPAPRTCAYYQALAYREEHGHLDVPVSYRSPDGTELGYWLKTQRAERDRLAPQQVTLLEEAGIEWEALSAYERKWREGLAAATRYHAVHGDLGCAVRYVDEDGFRLGTWLSNKRKRSDRISPDQRAALDNLNMRWNESLARDRASQAED